MAVLKNQENTISKTTAYCILFWLLLLTGFASIILFFTDNKISAYSALLGGLAFILPNLYFAASTLRDELQYSPRVIVRRFYMGESGKLLLTGVFFSVCFILIESLHAIAFFTTYLLIMVMNFVGLALLSRKVKKILN